MTGESGPFREIARAPDVDVGRDALVRPVLEVPVVPALGLLVQRMLSRDPVDLPALALARDMQERLGAR